MTASPGDLRLVLFAVTVIAGVVAAFLVARGVGWRAAAPLVPIAATPLVPSLPIGLGISTDDVLPATGIVLGLLLLDWRAALRADWPRLLVLGAALMAAAGLVASIANATSAPTFATMALKSAGHVVFLALVAVVVVAATPPERRRPFVARAVALVATFEAVFGLLAWLLPLPGSAGLEATRQLTSLLGRVPGRVAGTTGLSPNFLGALFVISIPMTAALALSSGSSRARVAWWSATAAQVLALTLTFTRTSLIIAVGALVVLLLLRGDVRVLLGILVIVGAVMLVTPLGARMIGDANDRAALWTAAARMMVDEPLTGVGPGRTLVVAEADPERYRVTEFGVATNNAHNTILLSGAETGRRRRGRRARREHRPRRDRAVNAPGDGRSGSVAVAGT